MRQSIKFRLRAAVKFMFNLNCAFFNRKNILKITALTLLFVSVIPLVLTGCKLERLGLISGSDSSTVSQDENNKTADAAMQGYLSEKGFYEMKSLQKDKNPLTDANVRKAIMYAIDRQRIVEELLGDYGSVLNSLFPEGTEYFLNAWEQYNYNPELAREYLNRSGYDKDNPLFLTLGANSESESRQVIENIIKENLQGIGVITWIANKKSREWYMDDVKNGNYDLGVWSILISEAKDLNNYFASGKIPSMKTDINKDCNNFYWYNNQDYDFYANSLLSEESMENKTSIAGKLQQILSEDAVILPLYSRVYTTAYNKRISNIEIDYMDGSFLKNIVNMDINIEANQKKKSSANTSENSNIKSLVAGYEQEPYVFNPFISDTIYRDYVNNLILQGLWKKTGPDKFEPVLAESVTVIGKRDEENNNLRNTLKAVIKIKDGIYWQDGDPIVADDIIATINAVNNDESLSFTGIDYSIIKSIEKQNDKEFILTFNNYDSDWQMLFNFIFPAKLLENHSISSLFSEDIFGSGPYKLKEWKKGEYMLLEKNNYYNGSKPIIDELKFIFNSDINLLIRMLNEGSIDILGVPSDPELMKSIGGNKNLNLLVQPGLLFEHLALCQKPRQ